MTPHHIVAGPQNLGVIAPPVSREEQANNGGLNPFQLEEWQKQSAIAILEEFEDMHRRGPRPSEDDDISEEISETNYLRVGSRDGV